MKHWNIPKIPAGAFPAFCIWAAASLLLSGCSGPQYAEPNPASRFVFPGEQPAPTVAALRSDLDANAGAVPPPSGTNLLPSAASIANAGSVGWIRVGDSITVTFSDTPPNVIIQPIETRILSDGNITLHLNQTVKAAGKSTRQLEQEIRDLYVPRFYNYMTVSVKTEQRFYYVGGEVKNAGRQFWVGPITVLRAIDTAGGFTDFANRSKIELTRQNGEKVMINYNKARKNPKLDPEVYPNDQIVVAQRWM